MPVIRSVGTAVPEHIITQEQTRDFARNLFAESFRDIDRLLAVFESAQVEQRHFCTPLEWFATAPSWEEKNRLYLQHAVRLSCDAAAACLEKAGLAPHDVDAVVFVSSTGVATPSIDAYLFHELGLRSDIKRLPVWGLGCAGGASGLARGFDLAKAHPESHVLVIAAELCGLTFLNGDRSKSNLIATSLFADGAAAVLISGDEAAARSEAQGPEVLATRSTIWPDTLDVMGWDVRTDGLKVIFSKDIPTIVETKIRPVTAAFLENEGLALQDVRHYIAHPGGMKVLKAYDEALDLPPDALRHARDVLRTHGNMSSCTVLFVLARELQDPHHAGEHGLLFALGPGFSSEQVLLRW
ncbi:15-methylpalmitoyl-4-hydroxy-2-pyrone synthase [Tumebacillus sp. BK434]|uniref:type III polyketide synthase n=1 Tax=Tumebacillus sp. BK434 TaxID=2512169 RepID=UPI00104D0F93|nr:3-oxoacyl-[acyl-carrier-protein] synthase III C-terminal domain-containing protein [Tumebacillus sp. BK434]TCP58317.1 15-methylpalmitoyl-4-hydroxy-2-pyrone synthase [Tumebacillus sp. BK434]